MDLVKGLIDDVVRLRCEISDMKRDHDALQKKHTELLTEHERVSNLLEMYCAEARREIEKKEFNIVDAVVSASVVGGASAASVASVENVIVNNDVTEDKTVTLDPIESKKAKRKAYMRAYMKMKRDVKGDE
jgi:vacuolar-type H+-ATPase subunit D/Vma8